MFEVVPPHQPSPRCSLNFLAIVAAVIIWQGLLLILIAFRGLWSSEGRFDFRLKTGL